MPVKIQTLGPNHCWLLYGYLVSNTSLIFWFYPSWWCLCYDSPSTGCGQPPVHPLRLSPGILFPGLSLLLFLTLASRPPSSTFISPCAPSLLCTEHTVVPLSVYLGVIFKILATTGAARQKTSQQLHVSAGWPHVSLVRDDFYPQDSKPFKNRGHVSFTNISPVPSTWSMSNKCLWTE